MDATGITVMFLFLCHGCVSNQMVPDTEGTGTGDNKNDTAGIITACTNSRGAVGGCVERLYCNYNTSHIDLTVYGPPGYRDPCQSKGVCCPTEYILPVPPAKTSNDDADVDFDDE